MMRDLTDIRTSPSQKHTGVFYHNPMFYATPEGFYTRGGNRVPRYTEITSIVDTMRLARRQSHPGPFNRLGEVDTVVKTLRARAAGGTLYVINNYAVSFEVGTTWYTSEPVMIETFVVVVDSSKRPKVRERHIGLCSVVKSMEWEAKAQGAKAILASDSGTSNMGAAYMACGFTYADGQFFKEINYG